MVISARDVVPLWEPPLSPREMIEDIGVENVGEVRDKSDRFSYLIGS